LDFMSKISDGAKQNTKKLRFTLLSAFFNFVKNSLDPQFNNPCDNPQLRKLFRAGKAVHLRYWKRTLLMKSFSEPRTYETG
jgi:integrase/recombinase XerD